MIEGNEIKDTGLESEEFETDEFEADEDGYVEVEVPAHLVEILEFLSQQMQAGVEVRQLCLQDGRRLVMPPGSDKNPQLMYITSEPMTAEEQAAFDALPVGVAPIKAQLISPPETP